MDVKRESKYKTREQSPNDDYSGIDTLLEQYSVELPSDAHIDRTIEALRPHVPQKNKSDSHNRQRLLELMNRAAKEIPFFGKLYWICCLSVLLTGLWLAAADAPHPYAAAILFAPVPFIIGLLEVFKGREQGVLEIELACKVSAQEIMLSRLLFVVMNSIVLNTCLSSILSLFRNDVPFWDLTWSWLTPFLIVASTSLWLAMRIRGSSAVMILVSVWIALGMIGLTNPDIVNKLLQVNLFAAFIVNAGALLLLFNQGKQLLRKHSFFVERSLDYEANDSGYI
ncbi:hypothetical protein M3650_30500 [Paenibacillus sp. MER TA 81-3]|uniref:hypothetical protein n=1 Tax=Paenibacillus sp. MER TA 81-3 TaxID=2939573 RepID=UPI00203ECA1D|nr:hypothetical protein [Paenibacillus sp. MER TA 81-3]MCM3342842.1 hypothetical protein [Paenibacillus sp. MER TA 81-3]